MSDPRNRGAAQPVPTKGEGCTRRFDPDAVSDQHGADFSDAARLWQAMQEQDSSASELVHPTPAAEIPPDSGSAR